MVPPPAQPCSSSTCPLLFYIWAHHPSILTPPEMFAGSPPLLLSLLLLHLLLLPAHSTARLQPKHNHTTHIAVRLADLLPAETCSTPKSSKAAKSLKISHSHGPCSPLGGKTLRFPSIDELHLGDDLRYAYLQRSAVGESKAAATLPVRRGVALSSGNYLVTVDVGTPARDQVVVVDTGSTVCWIQCLPCNECYSQSLPIFNPSESSSFRNVSCSSPACGDPSEKGCSSGSCTYGVRYGDGSVTTGLLAQETLTLTTSDVFEDFVFGCGNLNEGLFGQTSGILGLSRRSLSLVSQTASKFGGVFSYCLPRTSSSTGELRLGSDGVGESIAYTPMLTDSRAPGLYFVDLTGISVAGELLLLPPTVFSTGGTIVDSGTVITRLPPSAYGALRLAFRSRMAEYRLGQPAGQLLDTCYDMRGRSEVFVPDVVLHLRGGAAVRLAAVNILYVLGLDQVCLAFAANGAEASLTVIGNTQQRAMEVVYDLAASRIGFGTGSCTA